MSLRPALTARSGRRLFSTAAAQVKPAEWDAARPYDEIPGPTKLPILGTKYLFMPGFRKYDFNDTTNAHRSMQKDYGNIVRLGGLEPRRDMVMVYTAEDIETVFRADGIWPERPAVLSMKYYREVHRKNLFKGVGGVVNDQGEKWQISRSLVNPVMMQIKTARQYAGAINNVSEDFIKQIPEWRDAKNEMPEDFKNELHKWALESIAVIALDTRLGCMDRNLAPDSVPQQLINAIHQIFLDMQVLEMKSILWNFIATPTFKRFLRNADVLFNISYAYIQEAMERYKKKAESGASDQFESVLERFLQRDPDPTRSIIMALDMLFAGVDTTSHALTNVLLHLSANQDKQELLFKEVSKFLPQPDTPITYDMLDEMKYLKACVKESMRLRPVSLFNARTSTSELVLSGYRIPKNVDLILTHGLQSVMEKHYPEPERFIPERWIRGGAQAHSAHPFVTLPFGFGVRKCVGMRFANMELEMLLAKMIRRFQWDYKYGPMTYQTAMILTPVDPLKFTVIDR